MEYDNDASDRDIILDILAFCCYAHAMRCVHGSIVTSLHRCTVARWIWKLSRMEYESPSNGMELDRIGSDRIGSIPSIWTDILDSTHDESSAIRDSASWNMCHSLRSVD